MKPLRKEHRELAQRLADDFIAWHKLGNFVPVGNYLMSEAAAKEFDNQDIFATLEDFIEAMPAGVRGIHAIPLEITAGVKRLTANSQESEWFQTTTFVTPTEEMLPDRQQIDDESIFRVDSPYDLPKEQTLSNDQPMRDWNESNADNRWDPSFNVVDDTTPDYSMPTDWPRDRTVVPEYNWNTHKENHKKMGNCGGDCGGDCGGGDCGCQEGVGPALGPALNPSLMTPKLDPVGELLEHIWHDLTYGG